MILSRIVTKAEKRQQKDLTIQFVHVHASKAVAQVKERQQPPVKIVLQLQ